MFLVRGLLQTLFSAFFPIKDEYAVRQVVVRLGAVFDRCIFERGEQRQIAITKTKSLFSGLKKFCKKNNRKLNADIER